MGKVKGFWSILVDLHRKRQRILTLGCRSSSLHAKEVSWMYQSGNKYKKFDNQVMNDFMDVSIGKQKNKNYEKYCFLTQKAVKITKARSFM